MRRKLLNLCMTALLSVASTAAWALSEVDGFYQIGTAADFAEYAALVNGGQKNANAILTADIDLGTDIDTYKIYDGEYLGTFDGAGHTITINFSDGTKDNQGPALFRSIGNQALIKRLKVQGTITTERQHAAAFANYSGGVIRDCWADVTINVVKDGGMDDGSAAAFVGQCNKNCLIENCLAQITIEAPNSHKFGGVAAWSDAQRTHIANCLVLNSGTFDWSDEKSAGLVRNDGNLAIVDLNTYNADSYYNRPAGAVANNYVLNDWGFLNKGTTVVTDEEVASGKICYQLNSDQTQIRWKQTISTDPYPVPAVFAEGSGQVYASAATDCQGKGTGELTFSNSASGETATAHTYDKYGVCTTCGQFNWNSFDFNDPNKYDPLDRSFLIRSGDDLFLAEGWNRLQNGLKFNLKLMNDVTCTPPTGQLIFNNSDWSECSFNGQGHELTIEFVDIPDQNPAFLPKPYAYATDFVFENVIMHGTISSSYTSASPFAGSISSREYGGKKKIVRNVFSDITINTQKTGDNSCGGLMGCADGVVAFENCIYAGDINAPEGAECLGGLCGWTSNANTSFTNCAFLGTLNNAGGDSHTLARNYGNIPSTNVYSINSYGAGDESKYTKISPAAVESGELAYKLNGSQGGVERFYQVIGTDLMPMPIAKDDALVYVTAYCGEVGNPAGYTNTPTQPEVVAHQFENGFCSACGAWDENYMTPDADGWYNISNGAELTWWSIYESKNAITNARLTADINMEGYMDKFVAIGNTSKLYTGTFDGQGHVISNFKYQGGDYSGMFGTIGGGAVIKNFVLDNTCSIKGNAFCGIAGGTNGGGDVYLSNLGNEGTVTGTAQNVCGILGVDMGGSATLNISNCYVTGSVKGARESATICGWSNGSSKIENCYSIASLQGIYGDGSFTRGSAAVVNCYELDTYGQQPSTNKITAAEVASGALCFKLNSEKDGLDRFYQKLGTDDYPTILVKDGGLVYSIAESYRCDGEPLGEITGYDNAPAAIGVPEHAFTDGACDICSTIETDADGYAKIINAKTMKALSIRVNDKGDTDLKARMYADVDMTAALPYTPIGAENRVYTGEFDGQGHVVKNLVLDNGAYQYQGLFGRIGNGAVIKNFIFDSSCSIKADAYAGMIGGTNGGGDVYLSNLGNEGTIITVGRNAGGILGVDMNGTTTLHITNCYVSGAVNGGSESATICAWSNAASVIENCWSTATLTGKYGDEDSFTRGSAACVNCYEIEGVGTQNNKTGANRTNIITAAEVANGGLCAKLNTTAFRQNLGEGGDAHPVFDQTHGVVKEITEVGYATMYIPVAVEVPTGVEAFTGEIEATWLKLNPVGPIAAQEPVILKGAAGFYSFAPATGATKVAGNVLKGADEDINAVGKYILAKPDDADPVGFYKATTGTIKAGKAYLEVASDVKAFLFDEDGATGISTIETANENGAIYNLAGQRLQKMQKGINIVNGKKVLK